MTKITFTLELESGETQVREFEFPHDDRAQTAFDRVGTKLANRSEFATFVAEKAAQAKAKMKAEAEAKAKAKLDSQEEEAGVK